MGMTDSFTECELRCGDCHRLSYQSGNGPQTRTHFGVCIHCGERTTLLATGWEYDIGGKSFNRFRADPSLGGEPAKIGAAA